ncbi:MAG: thioredoxin family protein [Lewinellaceae bacterium]|nr:thioredoxin family protein [Saprospiraceae bacterium]MCB9337757.1 thioredoxin family protein [Lewinellaceae bacterium]
MMKFSIVPLAAFLVFVSHAHTQEIRYDRVDFKENPNWESTMDEARRTGKVIFLDGYTTWCAPCKRMDREVFTRPEVANFFNQKFINVKYDMEMGEGRELKTQLGIGVFPTYLFIAGNGQVVHRIIGAHLEGNEFLDYSKMAVTPGESYLELQQRYRNGERNSDFMFKYLKALKMAGEENKGADIVDSYFSLMTIDHFLEPAYWDLIKRFMKNPLSREFRILLMNREEIVAANGTDEVDGLIYRILNAYMQENISTSINDAGRAAEEELIGVLRQAEFPRRSEVLARLLAVHYNRIGDWNEYASLVDAIVDFNLLEGYSSPLKEVNFHAANFAHVVLDESLLRRALRWSAYTCDKAANPPDRAAFLSTKAALLEKLGLDSDAEAARSDAIKARNDGG